MLITYQSTLLEKRPLAPGITHFRFSRPTEPAWNFLGGQYMIFHIPQDATHAARRLYSIASPPSRKDSLEFIIEHVENGIASTHLAALPVNGKITMQGPAGVFVHKETNRTPVFLATGTGIAPMYAIIYELLEKNYSKHIYLFWGLKLYADLYYFDIFKALSAKYPSFRFKICLSREVNLAALIPQENSNYFISGRVTAGFEELLNTEKTADFFDYYLCGSKQVVEGLREYLNTKNVPKEQVCFEKFTV